MSRGGVRRSQAQSRARPAARCENTALRVRASVLVTDACAHSSSCRCLVAVAPDPWHQFGAPKPTHDGHGRIRDVCNGLISPRAHPRNGRQAPKTEISGGAPSRLWANLFNLLPIESSTTTGKHYAVDRDICATLPFGRLRPRHDRNHCPRALRAPALALRGPCAAARSKYPEACLSMMTERGQHPTPASPPAAKHPLRRSAAGRAPPALSTPAPASPRSAP